MLNILSAFFEKIYDLLPDSPFQAFFADKMGPLYDMLGWINWFIPFDICFKITEIWVIAISAYYLFMLIKKIVFDLILKKLLG
ncbi:MAG: hypothetical protein OSJ72_19675 [Lachnospiraceae bacterium]|nr:hypothetical protein [Lachnospiraceae bacterium]